MLNFIDNISKFLDRIDDGCVDFLLNETLLGNIQNSKLVKQTRIVLGIIIEVDK